MILLFSGEMRVVKRTSSQAATWSADIDRSDRAPAKSPAKKAPQARSSDDGATSTRAVIASSVFIVLLAATLLVGGGAAIDPFLRSAMADRDARANGDIVVTMPDGKFCRHMSFDNATATMVEGTVEPCKSDIVRDSNAPPAARGGFAWGVR
jgi:tRNA A37 threonylcarbamoyltransferase TsaD